MDSFEIIEGPEGRVVVINGKEEITDLAGLQMRAPDIDTAQLVQLAIDLGPPGYDPITDPAAYEAQVRAKIDGEDLSQPWREGVIRISDFGMPDFSQITAPERDGGTLRAPVRDRYTGLPYIMTLALGHDTPPRFAPLPVTPIERPASEVPAGNIDASDFQLDDEEDI